MVTSCPRVFALLALLLVNACSGPAALAPKAVELNNAGAKALARGELTRAGASLELALQYHPEFVEALANLGLVEAERGNLQRAVQLLARAHRLNGDIAQPVHGLGVVAERRRHFDRAADFYRKALAIDPGFIDSRQNLARLLYQGGRYEHALVEYQLLAELEPRRVGIALGWALSLISLGRLAEAETVIADAKGTLDSAPELALATARILLRRGRPVRAQRELLVLAGRQDQWGVEALCWGAVAALMQGQTASARATVASVLNTEPEHPLATWLAARLSEGSSESGVWRQRARLLTSRSVPADLER